MLNGEKCTGRPLRWGMVGGGRTGQVGYKHRTGALRDGNVYKLVCGAFDVDAARGKDFGVHLGVEAERCYADYETLIAEEAKRNDAVEVVSVATPNFSHYEITKALLEHTPELTVAFAAAKEITPTNAVLGSSIPFHPGSVRYYKEKGITVPSL